MFIFTIFFVFLFTALNFHSLNVYLFKAILGILGLHTGKCTDIFKITEEYGSCLWILNIQHIQQE